MCVLLFATLLALFTRWMGTPKQRRFLYGAFFVFGLLLTGNQEQIMVMPGLLLAVLLIDRELGGIFPCLSPFWLSSPGSSAERA